MMINEETLMLYYYDDGLNNSGRHRIEQLLRRDAVLAARFADLSRQLDSLAAADSFVAPTQLVRRLHDAIDREARQEQAVVAGKQLPSLHFMSFFWGAAITAVLATGIGIGYWFAAANLTSSIPDDIVTENPPAHMRSVPVAFNRGLQVHLQESQWEIANLPVDDQEQRALLVAQLIQQNRFLERTATLNNAPNLARVLRAFEPQLRRLASDEISAQDALALREKLAFEIGVMLTKISRTTSDDARTI
jgi:hypothetical protein